MKTHNQPTRLIPCLLAALLALAACEPPSSTPPDATDPRPPAPIAGNQYVQLERVAGTCRGEVDVVLAGFPARLSLDFDGDVGGMSASGTATITTQLATVACVLSTGEQICQPGPGEIPFLPSPPDAAAFEGDQE